MSDRTRVGVLLLQLGTPSAPTPQALRTYLAEFLSDPNVIDLPKVLWWPILHGIVLRTRPRRSARLYARIWTAEGSPLAVITQAQARAVQARLDRSAAEVAVRVAMRYGSPSIHGVLDELLESGISRILAVPLYPQYAGATTASSVERLLAVAHRRRRAPALRIAPPFYDHEAYVNALASIARRHLADERVDHVVVSFHGLPVRYARAGDPYPDHCEHTTRLLAEQMGWTSESVTLAYQSRFGPEPWLQPYTDVTLRNLATGGARRVAVMCPGFTADCLETLEEMAITNREVFMAAGGTEFVYVPCLNTEPEWIDALTELVQAGLASW